VLRVIARDIRGNESSHDLPFVVPGSTDAAQEDLTVPLSVRR
jgi:hypothetical protein